MKKQRAKPHRNVRRKPVARKPRVASYVLHWDRIIAAEEQRRIDEPPTEAEFYATVQRARDVTLSFLRAAMPEGERARFDELDRQPEAGQVGGAWCAMLDKYMERTHDALEMVLLAERLHPEQLAVRFQDFTACDPDPPD